MISSQNKLTSTFLPLLLLLTVITSCKKQETKMNLPEFGSVTDVCGNTYTTIKIGNQWWMAEDLRTTKYTSDTSFISLSMDTMWQHKTTGAYCNVLNNQSLPIGRLYNWYAVTDPRGIAPAGWHIPNDSEWKELEQHLGMSSDVSNATGWRGTHEGEKLKVLRGTTYGWSDYSNVWNTNESYFSALSFGCRMFDSSWGDPGQGSTSFWWTSSQEGTEAWYRYLDYKNTNVFRYHGLKTYGFSVRCVKD